MKTRIIKVAAVQAALLLLLVLPTVVLGEAVAQASEQTDRVRVDEAAEALGRAEAGLTQALQSEGTLSLEPVLSAMLKYLVALIRLEEVRVRFPLGDVDEPYAERVTKRVRIVRRAFEAPGTAPGGVPGVVPGTLPDSGDVTVENPDPGQDVENYWTPERMRNAKPYPMPIGIDEGGGDGREAPTDEIPSGDYYAVEGDFPGRWYRIIDGVDLVRQYEDQEVELTGYFRDALSVEPVEPVAQVSDSTAVAPGEPGPALDGGWSDPFEPLAPMGRVDVSAVEPVDDSGREPVDLLLGVVECPASLSVEACEGMTEGREIEALSGRSLDSPF